jgi:hypothetical protein
LERLCEPVLPEYIDDSNGPDLTGRSIVWQMRMIAWNIHVTGRQELADCAFAGSQIDTEQQEMIRKEISGLVQRKIELYPRQMTAICDVVATLVNGSPRAKTRPGDTFPELPANPASEPEKPITAEGIAALRKEMKLSHQCGSPCSIANNAYFHNDLLFNNPPIIYSCTSTNTNRELLFLWFYIFYR